jgi:hypothetical protein
MKDIAGWWALLNEQIRRVIVNGLWSPIAPFSLGEIERIGGRAARTTITGPNEIVDLPWLRSEDVLIGPRGVTTGAARTICQGDICI